MPGMPPRRVTFPRRSADRLRADLDDELRFHLDERVAELRAEGVPDEEARRRASAEFGDLEHLRRDCLAEDARAERAGRRAAWLEDLGQDLAHAVRAMRRAPAFLLAAAVTLGLGIGATTVIAGALRATLLAELPYREPDRVVRVYGARVTDAEAHDQLSAADFVDFAAEQRGFAGLAAFAHGAFVYVDGAEPVRLAGARTTPNFLDVLGVVPALGRGFRDEDAEGEATGVILGDATWRRHFGADPGIVGRRVLLDGRPHTVVGVLPSRFVWADGDADLLVASSLRPALADPVRARKFHFLGAYARLRPGTSVEQGGRELSAIAARLARLYPASNAEMTVGVRPVREALLGRLRPVLLVLSAASLLVLLIACANVAGLILSRTVARRQELAIRAALGAGTGRLARQLLAESLVVSFAGGTVGVALAFVGTALLARLPAGTLPVVTTPRVDPQLLLVAVALTLVSGLLLGTAPALLARRRDTGDTLRDSSRTATGGARRLRLREGLVVAQVALALSLLVSAALLLRTVGKLRDVSIGIDPARLLVFDVSLPGARYDTPQKEDQFFDALLERLRALPGVRGAGAGASLPIAGGSSASLAIEGRPAPAGQLPEVGYSTASRGFLEAMGVPLRQGRTFDGTERGDGPPVVVVSDALARRFFPAGDALGARIRLGPNPADPFAEIIGVVGDIRQDGLTGDFRATAYVSQHQDHWGFARVVVRTSGDPRALAPAVRAALHEIDPGLPLDRLRTMDDVVDDATADRRLPMRLLGLFSLLALALAVVGVYGVVALSVSSRTRELGTRIALGARPRAIFTLVLRQGLTAAALGIALGVIGALAGMRYLRSLLYGVGTLDLPSFAGAAGLLVLAVLVACWLPALRATRVSPTDALRAE